MLVGTRDHRHADHAGDDARQRAFHAGDDDDDARGGEAIALRQHAMDAGDADVVERSTSLPSNSAVTAASSATGMIGRAGRAQWRWCPCRARHVAASR